jgi:hypothetical protein
VWFYKHIWNAAGELVAIPNQVINFEIACPRVKTDQQFVNPLGYTILKLVPTMDQYWACHLTRVKATCNRSYAAVQSNGVVAAFELHSGRGVGSRRAVPAPRAPPFREPARPPRSRYDGGSVGVIGVGSGYAYMDRGRRGAAGGSLRDAPVPAVGRGAGEFLTGKRGAVRGDMDMRTGSRPRRE